MNWEEFTKTLNQTTTEKSRLVGAVAAHDAGAAAAGAGAAGANNMGFRAEEMH